MPTPFPLASEVLEQPWLHHLAIAVDGPLTSLSADGGDMTAGAHGLYLDDTRILSHLTVDIDGGLSHVAAASEGNASEFFTSARRLGDGGADPSVEVHRRRELTAPTLNEILTVRSRASVDVAATLVVELSADGLDMADVKHGLPNGPSLPVEVSAETATWSTTSHAVEASWSSPALSAEVTDGVLRLRFAVRIAPGTSETFTVTVGARRTRASLLDADAGSGLLSFTDSFQASADDPRIALAVSRALNDAQHLALTDPEAPEDTFLAAGTPWYLTLFGRDSLWSARMLLPLGTELALGTLRTLARRQGTKLDPSIAEEPGKIPHEVRRGAENTAHELPPVYYGTVDATTLWICLLDDALAWGLPTEHARELLPALRGALGWLTTYAAPDTDGLIKYIDRTGTGLVNQGWKDSGDSIRFRDGRIADAPIALIEAQAYAVQAGRAGARLLREFGTVNDHALADAAETKAAQLQDAVRERFWVGEDTARWPAIALDGSGEGVTGIASNMGHCLGTGTFDTDEATVVTALLTAPNMLGNYGIRTFADDNGGYNPLGYHTGSVWIHDTAICALGMAAEGHVEEAGRVALTMLATTEHFHYRSPELHGDHGVLGRPTPYPASCRPQAWSAAATIGMITAALGLSCDVQERRLTIAATRSPFGAMTLTGLSVGGQAVNLTIDADGEVTAENLPQGWAIAR